MHSPSLAQALIAGMNASGAIVASGTYFYTVSFDGIGKAATRKMTMLK